MVRKGRSMTFKHGEEGTHNVCDEMLKKNGGNAQCCECTGHECMNESNTNDWEKLLDGSPSHFDITGLYFVSGGEWNVDVDQLKLFISDLIALAEARGEAKGEARGAEKVIEKLNSWEPVD